MSEVKIKVAHLPVRCEICHKSDQFDANKVHCTRCNELATPLLFKRIRRFSTLNNLSVLTNLGWQNESRNLLGEIQKFLLIGMAVAYLYMVIIYNFGNPITTYVGQTLADSGDSLISGGEEFSNWSVACSPALNVDDILFTFFPFTLLIGAAFLLFFLIEGLLRPSDN